MGHAIGIVLTAIVCGLCARMVAPWHWLAWVMLVPWLRVLDRTRTWPGAFASGVAMAVAFSVAIFTWFPLAMADYAGAPLWLAVAIALVATPLFQPQLVVFALVRHVARHRRLATAA